MFSSTAANEEGAQVSFDFSCNVLVMFSCDYFCVMFFVMFFVMFSSTAASEGGTQVSCL